MLGILPCVLNTGGHPLCVMFTSLVALVHCNLGGMLFGVRRPTNFLFCLFVITTTVFWRCTALPPVVRIGQYICNRSTFQPSSSYFVYGNNSRFSGRWIIWWRRIEEHRGRLPVCDLPHQQRWRDSASHETRLGHPAPASRQQLRGCKTRYLHPAITTLYFPALSWVLDTSTLHCRS